MIHELSTNCRSRKAAKKNVFIFSKSFAIFKLIKRFCFVVAVQAFEMSVLSQLYVSNNLRLENCQNIYFPTKKNILKIYRSVRFDSGFVHIFFFCFSFVFFGFFFRQLRCTFSNEFFISDSFLSSFHFFCFVSLEHSISSCWPEFGSEKKHTNRWYLWFVSDKAIS